MAQPILSMEGITKIYPNGIIANKDVDFSVQKGEIHALMGENGAGKSTLMKILFGEEAADGGRILLDGKPVSITSPTEAIANGIGMVHQHFMLVPSLTVAENVFLGMEPTKGGLLDKNAIFEQTEALAKKYNFKVKPKARVADISVGTKQKVEILKALARGVSILILDEPTAVLTPQETEELFHELEQFRDEGQTIIFISHKLKEIKQICSRITVMKKGLSMGTFELADMEEADISRLMVGRDVVASVAKAPAAMGETVLSLDQVTCYDEGNITLDHVSLQVREGEILGIAGVEGNGQQELVESIAGLRPVASGRIRLCGQDITGASINHIRQRGLSYISDDRIGEGTAAIESIENNLVADKMADPRLTRGVFLKTKAIDEFARRQVEDYQIVCDSPKAPVAMLSGGNMQKVVIAREFSSNPKMMVANQPTRGVDVGAQEFIHQQLVALRDQNAGVLLVSADLNEVISLSDSLVVLYNGQIVAYFEDTTAISEEEMGYFMLGLKRQPPEDIERRMTRDAAV